MVRRTKSLASALAFGFTLMACGSADSSLFDGSDPSNGNGGNNPNNSDVTGPLSPKPPIGPKITDSVCVSDVVNAEVAPTNLIFVYDRSGSMGNSASNPAFDPNKKWIPVGNGLKTFFGTSPSNALRASLQFFPQGDTDVSAACAFPYATPRVSLTKSSDPALVHAIDVTKPAGGTPTLPALRGAFDYARGIAGTRPSDKTAVVLVTDGEPGFYDPASKAFQPGCTNNDITHIADAARAAITLNPPVNTYVIGVGPNLSALNAIAQAGGTDHAIMVDVTDPLKTAQSITSTLNAIRQQEVSCDFALPPAPAGETIDVNAVNVVVNAKQSNEAILAYSKDCASDSGWNYDDPAAPTHVRLCSKACSSAKAGGSFNVSLAFGCKTKELVR